MNIWTLPLALLLVAPAGSAQLDGVADAPADSAPENPTLDDSTLDEASLPEIDELALDRDRYQRLTVPVTIAGKGPFRFLIDTGAQATVVTPRVTGPLGLEPSGTARLVALGSSAMVETVRLDHLEFANRSFSGLTAPLLQDRHIGADGILGLDSLQDLRVLIDFREDRIAVADARELGGNTGFEIVVRARRELGQMIITDADIDGVRTAVIIDTGAEGSHGNEALRRKLRARLQHVELTTDVNGFEVRSDLAYAGTLRIAKLTLSPVAIGYSDGPVFARLGLADRPALILGMRNLRVFERVAIDFAERKVLFDLPRGSNYDPLRRFNDVAF